MPSPKRKKDEDVYDKAVAAAKGLEGKFCPADASFRAGFVAGYRAAQRAARAKESKRGK